MAINLHTKYAKAVEERFHKDSLTDSSFSKKIDEQFVGVKTVIVTEVNTAPMNDYTRSGANRYGTPEELGDTTHEYTMTKDRSFTYTIDKGNNAEQQYLKNAGASLKRQMKEVVTPEIDKHRFSVWASGAGLKKTGVSVTKSNVYPTLLDAVEAMDNALVPEEGRTLYASTAFYKMLLQCDEYIRLDKTGDTALVKGKVGEILNMDVKKVPSTYLPEGVLFMIVLKDSAYGPVKLHEYQIHKDPPGISGHLVEGRFIYDAFVNETKKNGIYVATT
jgi:hypothetical protein